MFAGYKRREKRDTDLRENLVSPHRTTPVASPDLNLQMK